MAFDVGDEFFRIRMVSSEERRFTIVLVARVAAEGLGLARSVAGRSIEADVVGHLSGCFDESFFFFL